MIWKSVTREELEKICNDCMQHTVPLVVFITTNGGFSGVFDCVAIYLTDNRLLKHYYVDVIITDFNVNNDGNYHTLHVPIVRFGALLGGVFDFVYATLHYFYVARGVFDWFPYCAVVVGSVA